MHIFFNKNSNHFSGGVFSDNLFGKNTVIIMYAQNPPCRVFRGKGDEFLLLPFHRFMC